MLSYLLQTTTNTLTYSFGKTQSLSMGLDKITQHMGKLPG